MSVCSPNRYKQFLYLTTRDPSPWQLTTILHQMLTQNTHFPNSWRLYRRIKNPLGRKKSYWLIRFIAPTGLHYRPSYVSLDLYTVLSEDGATDVSRTESSFLRIWSMYSAEIWRRLLFECMLCEILSAFVITMTCYANLSCNSGVQGWDCRGRGLSHRCPLTNL